MNYKYIVGPSRAYRTVGSAIEALRTDLQNTSSIEQDVIIAVEEGGYPAFVLPDGLGLRFLKEGRRLWIKSADEAMPLILADKSSSKAVGVDLGSNNPNITVCGLHVRGFVDGIRVGLNSHYCVVQNCLVTLTQSTGIITEHANYLSILQNVLIDGDTGILSRFSHNITLLHNTVYLDGLIKYSENKTVGLFLQLHNPYGVGRGAAYVYGNMLIAKHYAAEYFHDDLHAGAIQADNNSYYSLSQEPILVSTDQFYSYYQELESLYLTRFIRWYGIDKQSIGDDPQLLNGFGKGKHYNDLVFGLKHTSPAIGRITRADLSSNYPAWVPTDALKLDITFRPRDTKTAIGALEQGSIEYLLNTKFHHKYPFTGDYPWCDEDWTTDVFTTEWKILYPALSPGYFYSHDREYYLYAKKGGGRLGEFCHVVVDLPSLAYSGAIYQDGKALDTTVIHDKAFAVAYSDLFKTRGRMVHFSGESPTGAFELNVPLSQCEVHYFLPEEFVPGAPVVITDDTAGPTEPSGITNAEFLVKFNRDWHRYELEFPRSNAFVNPRFAPLSTSGPDYPAFWDLSGTYSEYCGASGENVPFIGEYTVILDSGDYVKQAVPVYNTGVFSFYGRSYSGSGYVEVDFEYYDANLRGLGSVTVSGFSFGESFDRVSVTGEKLEEAYWIAPTIRGVSGQISVLGPQYEEEYLRPFNVAPLDSRATVEFETSTGLCTADISISPYISYGVSESFLAITPLAARQFDLSAADEQTTLFDWRWEARTGVMPWARLLGKDKLRSKAAISSREPAPPKSAAVVRTEVADPLQIEITPSLVTAVQGDDYGVPFVLSATDTNGNPCGFYYFAANLYDPEGRNAGLLGKRYHGLKEQLSVRIDGRLTSFGTVCLYWVPPDPEDVRYRGPAPVPVDNENKISTLEVPYKIYSENGGSPVIKAPDGRTFSAFGSTTEEWLKVTGRQGFGIARPKYPVKEGSLIVYSESGEQLVYVQGTPGGSNYTITSTGEIYVDGSHTKLRVSYVPRYVFVNPKYPNIFNFYHQEVFGSYEGFITVDYPTIELITVRIRDQVLKNSVYAEFQLVSLVQTESTVKPYVGTRL